MNRKTALVAVIALSAATATSAQDAGQANDVGEMMAPKTLAALAELGVLGPGPAPLAGFGPDATPQADTMRSAFPANLASEGEPALRALDCDAAGCAIAVALDPATPEALAEHLFAVEQWVSQASPCPYSIAMPGPGEDGTGTVSVTIDCGG